MLQAWLVGGVLCATVLLMGSLMLAREFDARLTALEHHWRESRRQTHQTRLGHTRIEQHLKQRSQQPMAWPEAPVELVLRADELRTELAKALLSDEQMELNWRWLDEPGAVTRALRLEVLGVLREADGLTALLDRMDSAYTGLVQVYQGCALDYADRGVELHCVVDIGFRPRLHLRTDIESEQRRPEPLPLPIVQAFPDHDAGGVTLAPVEPLQSKPLERRLEAVVAGRSGVAVLVQGELIDDRHPTFVSMRVLEDGTLEIERPDGRLQFIKVGDPVDW